MKILASTAEKLKTCDTLFEEILNSEKANRHPSENKEDELRYTMFLMSFGEAVKHLNGSIAALRMGDDEIHEMCREAKVTVEDAIHNAHMNMMGSMLKDLLSRGLFPPPPVLKTCSEHCSGASLSRRVVRPIECLDHSIPQEH